MFDIGAFELLIVAVLALIVVGPKDLPRMLRKMSQVFRKIKMLSNEFKSGLDDLAREVDVDPFKDLREEEGLRPDMSPEEVTEHILLNRTNEDSKKPTETESAGGVRKNDD